MKDGVEVHLAEGEGFGLLEVSREMGKWVP